MDFNHAQKQFENGGDFEVIPENTIVDLVMTIRPGHAGDGGWLTQGKPSASSNTGWLYLDCEFTVIGGPFDKRKIWQNMMYQNPSPVDAGKAEKTQNITLANLRAILESARGIHPADESEAAKNARRISGWADFNGIQFKAKLKVEKGRDNYPDKNQIKAIITPDMAEHKGATVTPMPAPAQSVGQAAQTVVTQQATAQAAGTVPAWAR